MKKPAIPHDEEQRLAALHAYRILDTLPEQVYDDLTAIAAQICGTPIALVSLIDRDRQWFKSALGLEATETPRDISFCGHAVAERCLLVVPDATRDARFADNPLVIGAPDIRFYAGAPLITPDQHYLGTLCVIDSQPRHLQEPQLTSLNALARQVVGQLELRLSLERVHRAEAQAQEALRAERAASQAKSQFLANMSHELRTPLNAIIGYSEMLIEDSQDSGSADAVKDLQHIQSAGKHLLHLINDILDLAKIEASRLALYPETFDISALAMDAVELVRPMMEHHANRLTVRLSEAIGPMRADPDRTRQCLLNLLSNAAKFTDGGEVVLAVQEADGHIAFSVADTGIGIAPEDREKVFARFEQVADHPARRRPGTGIGLPLSRQLARLMGGDITFVSEPGRGSTFTLTLPRNSL